MRLRRTYISIFLAIIVIGLAWSNLLHKSVAQVIDLHSEAPKPIVVKSSGFKPKPVTEQSRQGAVHFQQLNCMACHTIHNTGGVIGPMLDGIGVHRSDEYLLALLTDSNEQKEKFAKLTDTPVSLLLHPRLTEKTAVSLVAFLQTLPEPPGGFILSPHIRAEPAELPIENANFEPQRITASSLEGQKLFNEHGCVACHSIRNMGGWLGPKLDGIGGRRTRAAITRYINAPSVKVLDSGDEQITWPQMPNLHLPADEVRKIVDFLATLPNTESASKTLK